MKHHAIPTVNVYIINDKKLLLSRRVNTNWMNGFLCAPGGHIEEGETPTVAIVREIKEELGVDINPNDLDFFCVAVRNEKPNEHIAFSFAIVDKDYAFFNNETSKCSELVWVDIDNIGDDVIDDFRTIFNDGYLNRKTYIEFGYK
jgi:mutator protein MutT